MLRKESVEKSLWDILINLNKNSIFKDYNLVGGTALSLQIGHRMSDDIDLFTGGIFDKLKILDYFYKNYKGFEIGGESDIFLNIFVGTNKIDFLKYDYPLLEKPNTEDGVKYLGIKDISAMKLAAIARSGDRPKDFIDIYYLIRYNNIKLSDMFDYYKKKFDQHDISHVKRSVSYFDDCEDTEWLKVRLINDTLDIDKIDEVKRFLTNEVADYFKSNIKKSSKN
jgi:hypothetical protein